MRNDKVMNTKPQQFRHTPNSLTTMTMTPALSPSIAATKTSRVEFWIDQLFDQTSTRTETLSPPLTPGSGLPLNQKRAPSSLCTCSMSTRIPSPKRPRCDTDSEILPAHSVSAAGGASNASVLLLNERNAFSPLGSQTGAKSPRRASSPSRDVMAILASVFPPKITEPSSGLKDPPPRRVRDVMERLKNGLDKGWIPIELRTLIEEDQDFGYQRTERHVWSENMTSALPGPIVDDEARIGF